jgi:hypothetical protein
VDAISSLPCSLSIAPRERNPKQRVYPRQTTPITAARPQNAAMKPDAADDDPTHALDDFVRRMRPTTTPDASAPDLSGLTARLHPERGVTPARAKGGVLRSGQRWDADDVEDVPVVEVPRVPPLRHDIPELTLPTVDLQAEEQRAGVSPEIELPAVDSPPLPDQASLDAATRQASEVVASQWDTESLDAAQPAWQPDPRALQLRTAQHPRLLAQWQPGAWTGAVRQVFDSTTEFVTTANGTAVETYPPHRLLLLWPPLSLAAPLPSRWPQQVKLSAVTEREAPATLADLVPGDALLWLQADPGAVDWALAAEIALHHAPALRPFQATGLRAFLEAEREATYARLNADYHQPEAGGPIVRR